MFKRDLPSDTIKEKYSDERSKFIEIDGFEVHYREEGTGKTLLLLHSLNTTLLDWEKIIPTLSENYRVIRLDLPGFGLSAYDKNFDFKTDTYIYFLKKFTAKIGLKDFHLMGVGWGADLAWHYSILHHYLVNKLILINPTDYPNYKKPRYQRMSKNVFGGMAIRMAGSKRIIKKRAKKWFQQPGIINEMDLERYQSMLLKSGNRKAFIRMNRAFHRDRYERLEKIPNPTLIIGSKDLGKNPLEDKIPNAKAIYYENARQYPMIEAPQQTADDVMNFIKD